jgi:sporulation protein YlmC with PRC-barrel domain
MHRALTKYTRLAPAAYSDGFFMAGIVSKAHCRTQLLFTNLIARYNKGMLQLSGMFINRPILSLRIGKQVALTGAPLINPNNLKIEGFYCQNKKGHEPLILLSQDVRDVMPQGIVINDIDVLTDAEDLVRLKNIIRINYEVLGKPVITASKEKIGKVSDYAVDSESLFIQKLYVTQSIFKSFSGGNLGVDRTQIIEITSKAVIIHDLQQHVPVGAKAVA